MKEVMILTWACQIGMAIARRMGYGKKIIVGDKNLEHAQNISKILNDAGFDARVCLDGFIVADIYFADDRNSTAVWRNFHAGQCSGSFPKPGIH